MPSTFIRNAAWVVAWNGTTHEYRRGVDLLLHEGRIASMAPHADAPPPAGAEVVDGSQALVLPGLVNIHSHPTTEPGIRGVREDHGVPEQQMTGLFERMQAMTLDQAGRAAAQKLSYAELLSAGVTSLVDLSAPFPGWLETMRDAGLRVWAGPGFASARWTKLPVPPGGVKLA